MEGYTSSDDESRNERSSNLEKVRLNKKEPGEGGLGFGEVVRVAIRAPRPALTAPNLAFLSFHHFDERADSKDGIENWTR